MKYCAYICFPLLLSLFLSLESVILTVEFEYEIKKCSLAEQK